MNSQFHNFVLGACLAAATSIPAVAQSPTPPPLPAPQRYNLQDLPAVQKITPPPLPGATPLATPNPTPTPTPTPTVVAVSPTSTATSPAAPTLTPTLRPVTAVVPDYTPPPRASATPQDSGASNGPSAPTTPPPTVRFATLQQGANLITWPGEDTAPWSALNGTFGNVSAIYSYDATSGRWRRYSPRFASVGNSLDLLRNGSAYWVITSGTAELVVPR